MSIQLIIIIGVFVCLYKKKIEKPSSDNENKKRNTKAKFCSESDTKVANINDQKNKFSRKKAYR